MRVLCFGKYPPIQGGISRTIYWAVKEAADAGHTIDVVTNAEEAEYGYRLYLFAEDRDALVPSPRVRIHNTQEIPNECYIPWANPYLSKLLGLGLDVALCDRPDLIVGWYFEPYGVAASLLGRILEIPVALVHAGSDLGFLASHPDLARSFRLALSLANVVSTDSNERTVPILEALGVPKSKLWFSRISPLPHCYRAPQDKLDIQDLCARSSQWWENYPVSSTLVRRIQKLNEKNLNSSVFTISVYGKVGSSKGSYDLINALSEIADNGVRFNFLTIPLGNEARLSRYFSEILERKELCTRTWLLPPLAPWRIPSFLSCCDLVCCLEHDFAIEFHSPQILREVLASQTCLVCSREVADKSGFADNLADGKNAVIIEEPSATCTLVERLQELINKPDKAKTIAAYGKALSSFFEDKAPGRGIILDLLSDYCRSCSFQQTPVKSDPVMNEPLHRHSSLKSFLSLLSLMNTD